MLCREMAQYRVSSSRRVLHLSEFNALARKDTLEPCVSLAMPVATPGSLCPIFHSHPVTLPDKPVALEYSGQQGQVRAAIIYIERNAKRVFVVFCKEHWHKKKTWLDNFQRAVKEAKHANEFRPNEVMWEKTSKGLLRNPDRLLRNTDKKMIYICGNIFFAKKRLYLWLVNGQIQRDSLDSNDACAHVDL
ncbi:hypothetical protein TNCV_880381 [Trichonephila clavipes]|nr:hypothetical protein TNCV_880381 [Trichonephila clavipes]